MTILLCLELISLQCCNVLLQIGLCYVLGTLFHSKDQRMLGSWSDWLLQQLDKCPEASEWLLRWAGKSSAGLLTRMLLQCPAQPLKQIFMRLVLRAIQVMRTSEKERYLQPFSADSVAIIDPDGRVDELGMTASVTEFMKTMLSLVGCLCSLSCTETLDMLLLCRLNTL